MGKKIFVSYKYLDCDVRALPGVIGITRARDYVDYIQYKILTREDHVYKGEKTDEDLSQMSDWYIWDDIKKRIYDSSVTIVLISPNMRNPYRSQKDQWIPREISYSLREVERNDRISRRNAILAVVLPDRYGMYDYYSRGNMFPIIKSNVDNGYIKVVSWSDFLRDSNGCIAQAMLTAQYFNSSKLVVNL